MQEKNPWLNKVACNLQLDDKAGGGYALRVTSYTLEEMYQAFKGRYDHEKEIQNKNNEEARPEPEGEGA